MIGAIVVWLLLCCSTILVLAMCAYVSASRDLKKAETVYFNTIVALEMIQEARILTREVHKAKMTELHLKVETKVPM